MQKGIGDIQLKNRPSTRGCQLKHCVDRARIDKQSEGVGQVHVCALSESTNNPTSFVALDRTIGAGLVAKQPFCSNDIGIRGVEQDTTCGCVVKCRSPPKSPQENEGPEVPHGQRREWVMVWMSGPCACTHPMDSVCSGITSERERGSQCQKAEPLLYGRGAGR